MRAPGPDRVTSDLLWAREALHPGEDDDLFRGRAAHPAGVEDDPRRASRVRTADSIRQRLDNMNEQFTAIQHMSDNMEHDFKKHQTGRNTSYYTTLPSSIQHFLPLHNTTSLYTTLPPSIQHYLPLHNTTSLYTTLPPSTQHYLPLYNTTSLYITLPPST